VDVGQDLERPYPCSMVEDLRRNHQFVGSGAAREGVDA
jgi:hypothetical protein